MLKALPDSEVLLKAQAVQLVEHLAAARAFRSAAPAAARSKAVGGLLTRPTPKRAVVQIALAEALAASE